MVTRVIGIPDRNGIITVSCGGDLIEIQVVTVLHASGDAADSMSSGTGGTPPATNPFTEPFSMNPFKGPFVDLVQDLKHIPFQLPSAYILSTAVAGKIDTANILKRVRTQIADRGQTNPRAVVLGLTNANLHELSTLSQKISSEALEVPIAIDFSGLLKR